LKAGKWDNEQKWARKGNTAGKPGKVVSFFFETI